MSRADELTRLQFCEEPGTCCAQPDDDGEGCDYFQAVHLVNALEAELAQRDQRIAELMETRVDMAAAAADYDRARVEVPEWCKPLIQGLVDAHLRGGGLDELDVEELLDGVETDQLRSCGIETT